MFTVVNEGEVWLLGVAFNGETARDFSLRLFTNNLTLAETSVYADFTECVATSYLAVDITKTNFTAVGSTLEFDTDPVFTFNSACTIYGYYLVAKTDNKVILAEKFASAYAIPGNGSTLTLPVTIALD